jgi:hypothetical protein
LFYNLEAVIAVGYRVNSERGIAFRTWATDKLKNYIFKGFAIDSQRFKNGSKFDIRFFDELLEEIREIRASERMAYQKITDIYATSVDYVSSAANAQQFFATVKINCILQLLEVPRLKLLLIVFMLLNPIWDLQLGVKRLMAKSCYPIQP